MPCSRSCSRRGSGSRWSLRRSSWRWYRRRRQAARTPARSRRRNLRVRSPGPGRLLVAKVLDIQPNKDVPVLELRFAKDDADLLPSSNKGVITLKIGDVRWQGTIGITGTNPPYVHSNLRGSGTERSMTELLRGLGVKEKGTIESRGGPLLSNTKKAPVPDSAKE